MRSIKQTIHGTRELKWKLRPDKVCAFDYSLLLADFTKDMTKHPPVTSCHVAFNSPVEINGTEEIAANRLH